MIEITLIILAYLIGSIPTAVWFSKSLYGMDIREHGSMNAGATNTFRVLGKRIGSQVLAIDILKGVAAVLIYRILDVHPSIPMPMMEVSLGVAAVIGHLFPIWADFRGGKGVATTLGMILAINPLLALALIGVFLFVLVTTNYVSLGSVLAALVFPIFIFATYTGDSFIALKVFAVMISLLVVYKHQKNIQRLLQGTENKIFLFRKNSD